MEGGVMVWREDQRSKQGDEVCSCSLSHASQVSLFLAWVTTVRRMVSSAYLPNNQIFPPIFHRKHLEQLLVFIADSVFWRKISERKRQKTHNQTRNQGMACIRTEQTWLLCGQGSLHLLAWSPPSSASLRRAIRQSSQTWSLPVVSSER